MIYIDRIEVVNKLAPYAGISRPGSTSRAVPVLTPPVAALSWFAGLPFSMSGKLPCLFPFLVTLTAPGPVALIPGASSSALEKTAETKPV